MFRNMKIILWFFLILYFISSQKELDFIYNVSCLKYRLNITLPTRLFLFKNLKNQKVIYFMKHMIEWSFSSDTYEKGMKQFLETGGPAPEGLTTLGRWHAPWSKTGFHLVEGNPADVTKLTSQWASLVDLNITPVVDDDEAREGLSANFL